VSEDGAPRNDSSDAGERREGSRREAAPVRPESAGAKLDPAPVIAGDAGVVQALSLGSSSTPGVKLEAQPAPTEAQIVAQSVARGLTAAVNQRGGSITLRLVPESLGLVRIHMSIDRGAVSVRLEATNPAAQGLLTEHIAMLRGSLESRGLTIDKLSVQYSPLATVAGASFAHGSGQNSAGAGQQQSQGAAEQQPTWQDAAGGESRGRQEAEQEQAKGRSASGSDRGARESAEPGAQVARFGGRLRMRLETVA
jgi:flagellar hook-length control protein FliK